MVINVYKYYNSIELLYSDNQIYICKENYPMYKKLIKLHRGVDNRLDFVVKDKDYKRACVDDIFVKAKFTDPVTKEKVLEKYLTIGSQEGEMFLCIYEGDLVDVPAGFYNMVLQGEDNVIPADPNIIIATPFFTDQLDNISFDVEVTGEGDSTPTATIDEDPTKWTSLNAAEEPRAYYSSAFPGNNIRRHKNSTHTFVIYASGYSGTLQVLGSLDPIPPTDVEEYFQVEVAPGVTDINMCDFTGIEGFTITLNVAWIKFRLVDDPAVLPDDNGTLERLLFRS